MLATRIATAAVALPLVVFGILFLPTGAIALIFALFMLLGAWEWGALLRMERHARLVFTGVVAAAMLIVALLRSYMLILGTENLMIALACIWWVAVVYWIIRFPRGWATLLGQAKVGAVIGVVALVAPVAAVAYLHQSDDGALLVLTLFVLVWAADTGAYFAGRGFGRHKLAPRVSPGKTVEGAVGGLLAAMLAGFVCASLLGYDGARLIAFVVLACWVAVISIVGDLTISMFKRHAQLKDSGTLFPGHGGVLDRLDSVLAAAPWFVACLHWLPAQPMG